jgi:hypothetical protein
MGKLIFVRHGAGTLVVEKLGRVRRMRANHGKGDVAAHSTFKLTFKPAIAGGSQGAA